MKPKIDWHAVDPAMLTLHGYFRISNSGKIIARIDNPNWQEKLIQHGGDGIKGLTYLFRLGSSAADLYRRTYSDDTLIVPARIFAKMLSSSQNPIGYLNNSNFELPLI